MSAPAYPRDLAVRILTRVLSDHEALDEALALVCTESRTQARPWLQEVTSGTLRWKGRLDQAIDSVALKKKPTGWLRKMLLVAAYQLIGQERTSPGAVVSETVSEIKRKEGEAPARFANALLRKIADHAVQWRELPFPKNGVGDKKPSWASMPPWLWSRIEKERGTDWAQAYAMASFERPVIWIRSRSQADLLSEWAASGPLTGAFQVTEGGALPDKPGFAEGYFFVQDISSQRLIAEVSALVRSANQGRTVHALDLCAAPGGKSAGLAWEGFEVTATDLSGARMGLLKQTVDRMGGGVRVLEKAQVSSLALQDLVWVDAPCTGSGILRRHPDVRWLRREKDLDGLLKAQQDLIREGWERTRSGGFLAYSVCSVLEQEGAGAVLQSGLASHQVQAWFLTPQDAPHGDGFYCSLLKKP